MISPPLRNRKEDIPEFVKFYLNDFRKKYLKENLEIDQDAMDDLIRHSWPGNIRELQHTIERGVIMSNGVLLKSEDFNLSPQGNIDQSDNENEKLPDDLNLEKVEKLLIEKAMKKHGGNISKAAKELGLTRAALYRRMEKFNI